MDISKITDLQQLKAMAYDELLVKEVAENNLRAINQRIAELRQNPPKEDKKKE